jgi:two-component system sensor histidine kinase ResE
VVAYNDMLKQDAGQLTGQKLREYLEAIDEGATRLRRMIEDFIVLVEVETGEAIEAYNSHCKLLRDYPGFLLPIVERYEPALVNGSQTLRFDIDPATPPAPVHLPHFSKVIECLIDNAIKFGGPGNEITLRIASTRKIPGSSGQWISFEVSDHGRGIPERELPKIFDAFYQIDRQRTEDQGTGIGLAIVKGVVEAHGGQIQVRSRPGAGSTFIVLLPTHPN